MISAAAKQTLDAAAAEDKLEPGSVLFSSWGHDQTNINFYEIVRRTWRSAWIRPISDEQTHGPNMTGTSVPLVGPNGKYFYTGPVQLKRVSRRPGTDPYPGPYIQGEYGQLQPWDGNPKRFSTYG